MYWECQTAEFYASHFFASRSLHRRTVAVDVWKGIISGLGIGAGGVLFAKFATDQPFWKNLFPGVSRRSLPTVNEEKHQERRSLEKRKIPGKVYALAASGSTSFLLNRVIPLRLALAAS